MNELVKRVKNAVEQGLSEISAEEWASLVSDLKRVTNDADKFHRIKEFTNAVDPWDI